MCCLFLNNLVSQLDLVNTVIELNQIITVFLNLAGKNKF